jgi:transposase
MRPGAEYFTKPSSAPQRRYEALRAYLVDGVSAEEVGRRYGYSRATVYQLARELRAGRARFFRSSKPGPRGPRKAGRVRERVLELRARDHSVSEIAAALAAAGTPVSRQTVFEILRSEGLERLPRRPAAERGAPPRTPPVKARPLGAWPAPAQIPCEHAGLYLLVPAMLRLGLPELCVAAGYPQTSVLSRWHSLASLLLLKLARRARAAHAGQLATDPGLGLCLGLTALPKATHLTSYSYRVRREQNERLLGGLAARLRELGLATGEEGFNVDFHAIRHHGERAPLERNYIPRRSQESRSVLAFFAQDHGSREMVYTNADVTRAERATELLRFCDYWRELAGSDPGPLVFDQQLTTYAVLSELSARGIGWLTLRKRGVAELARLQAVPDSDWRRVRIERSGRYRQPHLFDELIEIKGIDHPVRQIAARNIGREEPTLLITNDRERVAKDLFARYAERMLIENELAAYISGFHLDALSSGLALNVDLDTTLTVIAGAVYRLFAGELPRFERATPARLHDEFVNTAGRVEIGDDGVTVALTTKTYTPVLLEAGLAELEVAVPWWDDRRLRFSFPPR